MSLFFQKSAPRSNNEKLASYREAVDLYVEHCGFLLKEQHYLKSDIRAQLNISALQRGLTFFEFYSNLQQWLYGSKIKVLLLPPTALSLMNLGPFERLVSILSFYSYIFVLSCARFLKVIKFVWQSDFVDIGLADLNSPKVFLFSGGENALAIKGENNKYRLTRWLGEYCFGKDAVFWHSYKCQKETEVNVRYAPSFLFNLSIYGKLQLTLESLFKFSVFVLQLIGGRWQPAFMVDDLLLNYYFLDKKIELFDIYIFDYQGTIYRPLWTFTAERRGARIILLNYSSSSVPDVNGKSVDRIYWKLSLWNEVIPFNSRTFEWVREISPNLVNVIGGPTVFLADSNKVLPENLLSERWVAVFDYPYPCSKKYIGFHENEDYMTSKNGDPLELYKSFFSDIGELCSINDMHVCLKPKRFSDDLSQDYRNYITQLKELSNFHVLDHDLSPYRVADSALAVLVLPFTSVGHYVEGSSPTVFYDPFSILKPDHPSCYGTNLVSGKKELADWLAGLRQI